MTAIPTNPLHLFRALLRECTYLPDARARFYMHNHFVWSYRNYLPKIPASRKEIPFKRQVRLSHRGRKYLVLLRRANEGCIRPLEKILFMSYGRTGKRRRELMTSLMRPEIPPDHKAVAEFEAPLPYAKKWSPPPKLEALLRSQATQQPFLTESARGGKYLKLKPNIPDKNIWNKPLHPHRVRNMTHKWYRKVLERLLPPLPEKERNMLWSLATGKAEWSGPIRRRKRTGESSIPVSVDVNAKFLLAGPDKSRKAVLSPKFSPHNITSRFMRRMWASIYRQVPKMTWDVSRNQWSVQWDDIIVPRVDVADASEHELALYFGNTHLSTRHRDALQP